ncbi:MAG: ribonuclease R [Nitrospirae bacterium]|nr:ribonuclease R [Nitrospirota bacterium]
MIPEDIKIKEAILNFLKTKTERPVSVRELTQALKFHKRESGAIKRALKSFVQSGDAVKTRYGLYGPAEKMNLTTGYFEAHRDGFGFVIPDKRGARDLFIPPRRTSGAMSGDRVVVRIESPSKREGRIIQVLERAQKKVVGRFYHEGNIFYVKPKSRKIPFGILISPGSRAGARNGDNVVVEISSYPTSVKPAEARVLKILPDIIEPGVEIDMIVEEYSLQRKFPPSVLSEVKELGGEIPLRKRVDCRKLLTVTIDGETAKDFDDAISINRTPDGFILYVHIADVSHYVPWDSAVDFEARRRGTSVYFPGSVIPMLPEKLSNDLCSLVPRQDRPTFTVEMRFDNKGQMLRKDFYPSVIHSNERMTYTSVRKILDDKDLEERKRYEYLLESFELMEELCEILRRQRIKRGSLDFDLPEPEVLLNIQGMPEAIIKAERNLAHMMIEEFMIAANEAVASHLESLEFPSIYRIHEKPDPFKLDELRPLFASFGMHFKKAEANTFQALLKKIKGTVEESLLNILLLRSLKQAKYSTENTGHFGLASESYTHFTSPIRRYPDLVVHRILKDALTRNKFSKQKREHLEKLLPDIAANSSKTERVADEAEREIVNAMRVWFMKDKVGDEYAGLVSNISSHGLKIQLKDFFVEGFLHVSSMPDDYYVFDEKSYRLIGRRRKKTFTIGKEVNVRIERVDIEEREIVLGLV